VKLRVPLQWPVVWRESLGFAPFLGKTTNASKKIADFRWCRALFFREQSVAHAPRRQ
jgi:hypothetical protein